MKLVWRVKQRNSFTLVIITCLWRYAITSQWRHKRDEAGGLLLFDIFLYRRRSITQNTNLLSCNILEYLVFAYLHDTNCCQWATFDITVFNMAAWLSVQTANFQSLFYSSILKREIDTKKTTPDIEVCRPEGLGAMLQYWYIKRGLVKGKEDVRSVNVEQGYSHTELDKPDG